MINQELQWNWKASYNATTQISPLGQIRLIFFISPVSLLAKGHKDLSLPRRSHSNWRYFFLVLRERFYFSLCIVISTAPYMPWHKRLPAPEAARLATVATSGLSVIRAMSLSGFSLLTSHTFTRLSGTFIMYSDTIQWTDELTRPFNMTVAVPGETIFTP